jgi:hypothetical protein
MMARMHYMHNAIYTPTQDSITQGYAMMRRQKHDLCATALEPCEDDSDMRHRSTGMTHRLAARAGTCRKIAHGHIE